MHKLKDNVFLMIGALLLDMYLNLNLYLRLPGYITSTYKEIVFSFNINKCLNESSSVLEEITTTYFTVGEVLSGFILVNTENLIGVT